MLISVIAVQPAQACFGRSNLTYRISNDLQSQLNKIYKRYNFSVSWGLYDIASNNLKPVATYNQDKSFQSNCTIKALVLLYICKQMDAGKLSLDTKLYVKQSSLSHKGFGAKDGKYTVKYLLTRMIHVSNNACYEVLLRYITKEKFNAFLLSLGSGTVIKSYGYMGDCTVRNRATEWFSLYKYCQSRAKHANFAWGLLLDAKFSPVRDGLNRKVAHKSGWYHGGKGTAGDCCVVKTDKGGCYLLIVFTKNNVTGDFSQALIRDLAKVLDKVWNEYYAYLPPLRRKVAKF